MTSADATTERDEGGTREVALIGAGPIGIEVAAELKRAGIDYVHFDKGQVGQTVTWYPQHVQYFSSNERLELAGVPLQTVGQRKATKEEYLAYLRTVVQHFDLGICTHEPVDRIEPVGGEFLLHTSPTSGPRTYRAKRVVAAIGDMHRPRWLEIPGEDLSHVSHYFVEPHRYFRKKLLIVGGRNSAVEAALRCFHAGVDVTMSYRGESFDPKAVKYWLRPELEGRIKRGEMTCYYQTTPVAISPTHVRLQRNDRPERPTFDVDADFVLLMTGYVAEMGLLRAAGVDLQPGSEAPVVDEQTMETNVPGLYVAGTATAGTQHRYRVFIENCHVHAKRIVAALTGERPPEAPTPTWMPET